jgi:hypothetical protein
MKLAIDGKLLELISKTPLEGLGYKPIEQS